MYTCSHGTNENRERTIIILWLLFAIAFSRSLSPVISNNAFINLSINLNLSTTLCKFPPQLHFFFLNPAPQSPSISMYFFEIPQKIRLAQVACAVFWCLFGAGPIFGFAALKPVLVSQGIYEELCYSNSSSVSSSIAESQLFTSLYDILAPSSSKTSLVFSSQDFHIEQQISKCSAQDLKLNMMFTLGAVFTNLTALLIGRLLDSFGPRFCGMIGATCLFIASFIFVYAKSITIFDPYLFGYAILALGGPFTYISSFQLSNAFPEKSGLILALITGAFDTSSAVFLGYKFLYNSNPEFFTISNFFKFYLVVPLFIASVQLFLMPSESYLSPPPELIPNPTEEVSRLAEALTQEEHLHDENTALLPPPPPSNRRSSIGEVYKTIYVEDEIQEHAEQEAGNSNSIFGVLHGFPVNYQYKTWWFFLMCIFASIQMLRLNYFVATVSSQYFYLLHSDKLAFKLNKIFDIALPLGGVLSIPFIGMILDSFSTSTVLIILFIESLIIGLIGCVQNSFSTGVINVLLFVSYRPFFYTSVSDYCAKVFGFETFGTIYGTIMTTAGVVNFCQKFLDKYTHTIFKMNPIPLNLFLVALTLLIGGSTCVFVYIQSIKYNTLKKKTSPLA